MLLSWLRKRRRRKIRARSFPPHWLDIIERNVAFYGHLPEVDQRELLGHIQVFLAEKRFEGARGFVVDDEVRVTIAAQACLLLLHRDTEYYPLFTSIVVYPRAYRVPTSQPVTADIQIEREAVNIGESWHRGEVILSWRDVKWGAADIHDGENVVFHEFAHQLDDESGDSDGTPNLGKRSRYIAWARVLGDEYSALLEASERGKATLLDDYGAESPAEFFAVATECFFELPIAMKRQHPKLYQQLQSFFQQDPASWFDDDA